MIVKQSVLILIVCILLVGGFFRLVKLWQIEKVKAQNIEQLKKENENLKNENILLKKEVSRPIRDRIVAEIRQVFGSKAKEALMVAQCESNLNPDRINYNSSGMGSDHNVFQINTLWIKVFGDRFMKDYKENIRVAKAIFDRSGDWRHWSASSSCWKEKLANK